MRTLLSTLFVAFSLTACAVEDGTEQLEPELSETDQASSSPLPTPNAYIYLDKKPWTVSWENFCRRLNGEVRTTVDGCTTTTTYENCRRGAQDGTCICDVRTSQSGTCS